MRRGFVVGGAFASALALTLACNAILGIDGDVLDPTAVLPEAAPPADAIVIVDDSSIELVVKTERDQIAQGGALDFEVTATRKDYQREGPLRVRIDAAYKATDPKYPPSVWRLSNVGQVEGEAQTEFEIGPGVTARFRLTAPALALRGAAGLRVIIEDEQRRREESVALTVVGHIVSTFGSQGVALLDLAIPQDGFALGKAEDQNRDTTSALAAAINGDTLFLSYRGTVAASQIDGGPVADFEKPVLKGILVRSLGILDSGSVIAAGSSDTFTGFVRLAPEGGAPGPNDEGKLDAGFPLQASVTAAGHTYGVGSMGIYAGRLAHFQNDDVLNVEELPLALLDAPASMTADGPNLLVVGMDITPSKTGNKNLGRILRVHTDASIDFNFGTAPGGTMLPDASNALTVATSDAGYLVGGATDQPAMWRTSATGTLDAPFSDAFGKAVRDELGTQRPGGAVRSVVTLPSGKLLVAGYIGNNKAAGFIARVLPSGEADNTFAYPASRLLLDVYEGFDIRHMFALPDGTVLVVAGVETKNGLSVGLMRLEQPDD